MKWAIKVKFEDSYLYVTELGMQVKTFDTKEEAELHAEIWRIDGNPEEWVGVVEYHE